jgi:NAD(P)H-dependent FMN reductase
VTETGEDLPRQCTKGVQLVRGDGVEDQSAHGFDMPGRGGANFLDGYVLVTPEYNHSTSGALKNAIDFRYAEWNNKAAAFVSYGSAGGTRAVEHLRLIIAELQVATVRAQVALSLHTDFENFSTLRPGEHQVPALQATLDQLISWSRALRSVREPLAAAA